MTTRTRRRRLFTTLAVVVAAYAVWLGIDIARFRPPEPSAPSGMPACEVAGVYHVHTKFSDGRATAEGVAAAAARRSLDFVILTDHGNPNLASLASQGRIGGVLMLAGSELSVSRGHLVALDFATPKRAFPQNAESAVQEVAARGGFTVVAHPYSKTSWTWGKEAGFSGIELADIDSMLKRNYLRYLPYFPALAFKPELTVLKSLRRPVDPLRKWDSLAARHPLYGYFSVDAHFFYSAVFGCFRLHVLLGEPLAQDFNAAREQVFGALRRGRFYNAVDGAAPAAGFEFWGEADSERFPMGSQIGWPGAGAVTLHVRAPFGFAVETRLIRDGQVVERATGGELGHAAERSGVYRVEVYLRRRSPLADNFPWIVSNPIFINRS